jgi:aryl-alcohol dehydrogenase-like predicted oxidoreductase
METRQLGNSGISVSALGFGCWPIGGHLVENGGYVGWGEVDESEAIRALHHAVDLGVNFFDTANVYGNSEDILGRAFRGRRQQVVLASKFGKVYDPERRDLSRHDASPANMRRSLETSLRRLQTDYIDLFQLHLGDCPPEEAAVLRDALEDVVRSGIIRGYAWSTDDLERAEIFAAGPHCLAIQHHLNIFEGNRALLSFCEARQLASINRGPLGMGLLTGKYTADAKLPRQDVRGFGHSWMRLFPDGQPNLIYLERLSAVRELLTSDGRTLAQGALAWIWGVSANTIPIPGFKNLRQADENARALTFGPLTPEQMRGIEQILAPKE